MATIPPKSSAIVVNNTNKSLFTLVLNGFCDLMTVWLGRSDLKLWIKVWLGFLLSATLVPIVFLPHPFAIANAVGFVFILIINGRELIRVRGLAKNMGWPHIVAWIPVLIVDILCLSTDRINGEQLTWESTGGNNFHKARVFFVWYNLITLAISCFFDGYDTVMYYVYDVKHVDRSEWTKKQLEQDAKAEAFGLKVIRPNDRV